MNTEQRSEIIRRAAAKMWADDGSPVLHPLLNLGDEAQFIMHFHNHSDARKFSYLLAESDPDAAAEVCDDLGIIYREIDEYREGA